MELQHIKKILHSKLVKGLRKSGETELAKSVKAEGTKSIDRIVEMQKNMAISHVENNLREPAICEVVDVTGNFVFVVRCKFAKNLPVYYLVKYYPEKGKIFGIECERYQYDMGLIWAKMTDGSYYYITEDLTKYKKFEFATPLRGDAAIVKDETGYWVMSFDLRRVTDIVAVKEVEKKNRYGYSEGVSRVAITTGGQELSF